MTYNDWYSIKLHRAGSSVWVSASVSLVWPKYCTTFSSDGAVSKPSAVERLLKVIGRWFHRCTETLGGPYWITQPAEDSKYTLNSLFFSNQVNNNVPCYCFIEKWWPVEPEFVERLVHRQFQPAEWNEMIVEINIARHDSHNVVGRFSRPVSCLVPI